MTRKPQIKDPEAHVVVDHGADFFGEDRHPLKALISLAPYATNAFAWNDRAKVAPLVHLLENPGAEHTIPASQAAVLSEQLLRVSRSRGLQPKVSTLARALADAAARAAADGEPWEWRIEAA
jgi:hypothetical protein